MRRRNFLFSLSLLVVAGVVNAEESPSPGTRNALKGYDPVAYFVDQKAVKGKQEFSYTFDGLEYWFDSAEHRDMFIADPEKFAPQFQGYCAIALSRGKKVEADPLAWKIKDGKLYVFYGSPGLTEFKTKAGAIVKKANDNWSRDNAK